MLNKKVESEIAIGIILILVVTIGGLIWFTNNYSQNKQFGKQYTSLSMKCENPDDAMRGPIVFLGDSITALEDWSNAFEVPCIKNAGISGNITGDILSRLDVVTNSKPRKIFLMVGVNDLLRGFDVAYIANNYEKILNKIKLESPDAEVYIQSVLPINKDLLKTDNVDSQEITALNEKLKNLAEDNNFFFINLYPFFCGAEDKLDKKYSKDGLHPNSTGYAVWKKNIKEYMK